jgi:hypothetical protein
MKLIKLIQITTLFLGILLMVACRPESKSNDEAALALLLLDGSLRPVVESEGCEVRDRVTTTGGPPNDTEVNATSTKSWVCVSLTAGGLEVNQSEAWDLRFRRFVIGTNSGTSGSGNGGACDTGNTNFASVNAGSIAGCVFQVDTNQSQSGGGGFGDFNDSASPVLFNWYNYANTVLTSKGDVYIIKSQSGTKHFKIQISDYYKDGAVSGYPRFIWEALD